MKKQYRKLTDKSIVKLCEVCGETANGYNFNAITCESCKSFFRRNALTDKEYKCAFKQNCLINVSTRRYCRRCRLKKCFDLGMKKEWILSEEQRMRRKPLKNNRKNRSTNDNEINFMTDSSCEEQEGNENADNDVLDKVFADNSISDEEINTQIKEIENCIEDNAYEMSVISVGRPIDNYSTTFNELEANRLGELLSAAN
ncbi:unnamed protein product, partial [Medioppia subpectinata]